MNEGANPKEAGENCGVRTLLVAGGPEAGMELGSREAPVGRCVFALGMRRTPLTRR